MKQKREELFISLADLKNVLKKNRRKILSFAFFMALGFGVYGLTLPVKYAAHSTFREKGKAQANIQASSLSDLILNGGSMSNDMEAISLMRSRKLLTILGEKLHLQGELLEQIPFLPKLNNIKENLLIFYSLLINHKKPSIQEVPKSSIVVKDVWFDGELNLTLPVTFVDPIHFLIKDPINGLLKGELGIPFQTDSYSFTLRSQGDEKNHANSFQLTLFSLDHLLKKLADHLIVEADFEDKSLIRLKYLDRDRFLAKNILNELMLIYQEQLQNEHDYVSQEQLHYLEARENQLQEDLSELMQEHAHLISKDLATTGFINTEEALNFIAANLTRQQEKLVDIDLEMKRLRNIFTHDCAYYDQYGHHGDFAVINDLLKQRRDLNQQKDSLMLAILEYKYHIKEKSLDLKKEFQGIDLETANQLYISYSKDLSNLQAQKKQHFFLAEELKNPHFEPSSLSALSLDNVTAERVQLASNLLVAIKDEHNRSQKELERLKEDLAVHKDFLSFHLHQMGKLLEVREELIIDKVYLLQNTVLDLIEQKLTILQNHLQDFVTRRLDNLLHEKQLIEEHQKDLQAKLANMPAKWVSEELISHHLDMHKEFMENLTSMVEAKNISSHLELVQSTPIDHAYTHLFPNTPKFPLFAVFGFILGSFISICYLSLQTVRLGIPATADSLERAGFHVSGKLSSKCISASELTLDSDLNTLRRLIGYFKTSIHSSGISLLLIEGKKSDYSLTLARLLSLNEKKVLLLDLRFDKSGSTTDEPGLLSFLQGTVQEPKIIRNPNYDFIASGGITRFSEELLHTQLFQKLLQDYEAKYDWVIAITNQTIHSAEAENIAPFFKGVAISIDGEVVEDLQAFTESVHHNAPKLTCVIHL